MGKALREYVSPLLQPPLNRLFVPRPLPEWLPPMDRDVRTGQDIGAAAPYVSALAAACRETGAGEGPRVPARRETAAWDPRRDPRIGDSDPFRTVIVARLPYDVDEALVRHEFERYGSVRRVRLVRHQETGKSRGYALVEYVREQDVRAAKERGDGRRISARPDVLGRRVVVDVERGRTEKGWRPRRLGGGLGNTRK
jgi:U1 small nuclear ribonucleoprotein